MEAIQTLTPVQILMIAQTFVVLADGEAQPEEKESISVMFRKHVTRNEISDQQLQRLTSYAFNYADTHTFEEFLRESEGLLSPAQAISVLCNMYEMMIVDGQVTDAEKDLVQRFTRFFDIDPRLITAARELLMIKNDSTLFLKANHPFNGSDFQPGFIKS